LANFVVVVDADADRRAQFIRTVQPQMAVVDGLQSGSCFQGDCCVLWAAAPQAPVGQFVDNKGVAVLWGEAIPDPGAGPGRIDAVDLRDRWKALENNPPGAYDGFYAGVVYDSREGLIVGADLLGLFPVYYCLAGEAVLVGASQELFRHHPAFRMEFNPAGLVGILLTNGLVKGQTLLKGVRRLAPGHLLVCRQGEPPKEVCQYQIPLSIRYCHLSRRAHVEILDEALTSAIKRHVPLGLRYGLLLSGGLDSRLLAGYLGENRIEADALTWGLPTDIEVQCAGSVARTLGFPHRYSEPAAEAYVTGAQLQANYEHLANGFNQVRLWRNAVALRDHRRVVAGLVLDRIVTPHTVYESPFSLRSEPPFESALRLHNELGIPPEVLERLLRREVFGDLVREILDQLRKDYANAASSDFRRAWRFELWHRARFHVGSAAHRLSFGSWPVLPAIDRHVIEVLAGMPAASVEDRLVEKELLCNRFPELASLPLDRSSDDTLPLKPRLRQQILKHLLGRLAPLQHLLPSMARKKKIERRYWHRTADFNGPGWMGVRRIAEPNRKRVYALFRQDTFDSLVPAADVISSSSGPKVLLGSMLWAKDHL
jgi:asparagine synthase (glutamine-hydrolysing)